MPNAPNLREKIVKSVLTVLPGAKRDSHRLPEGRAPGMAHVTVAVGYGCGIFHDFLAHLRCISHSRYDSN